jgi:long-chain acyl-CoA synthetase
MAILIDFRFPTTEILDVVKKMNAKLLVTSKRIFADFERASKMFDEEHIEVFEISNLEKLKNSPPKLTIDLSTINLDQPAFTILTSGTTGIPKIAVHNLKTLALNLVDLCEAAGLDGNMTGVMPLPISHIFGLEVFLVTQILGVKVTLVELDPVGFVNAVAKYKPELIAALPQFFGALLSAPAGAIDLSRSALLLCGGAPLTVSLAEAFESKFGKRLNNGYGSTECKIVAINKNGPVLSVGSSLQSVTIDIVNERNEVLPEGACGEVRITSSMLMEGYLGNEEGTKKVLNNGRYHTGDIGRLENGNLFVSGRKGDMVIVAGSVVFSALIEEALRNHKDVREVAVVAVPNKRLGQSIKAVIVLNDAEKSSHLDGNDEQSMEAHRQLQSQFRNYCKQNLKRYMCPMKFEFLGPHDALPKTLAGKTDKTKL